MVASFSLKRLNSFRGDITNIHHCYTVPYWPSANGEVESLNYTTGKSLKCYTAEGKDWRHQTQHFLLAYCITLHSITQKAPAWNLFCRLDRNDIPFLKELIQSTLDKLIWRKDKNFWQNLKKYTDKKWHDLDTLYQIGLEFLVKEVKPKDKLSPYWDIRNTL